MMIQHESPAMLFDITTTRLPFVPTWAYDASCLAKEYGMNREPDLYSNMNIVTDPFHEPNHIACSESFKSSKYESLKGYNKEACEQINSLLPGIKTSLSFMKPKHYMRAIVVFAAFRNIKQSQKYKK